MIVNGPLRWGQINRGALPRDNNDMRGVDDALVVGTDEVDAPQNFVKRGVDLLFGQEDVERMHAPPLRFFLLDPCQIYIVRKRSDQQE